MPVKASKQHRYVAVKHQPKKKWLMRSFYFLLLIASAGGGYFYGAYESTLESILLKKEIRGTESQIGELVEHEADLRQQLINAKMASEVDRRASEEVRQEVMDLKSTVAKLEEENRFYRNLMSPSKKESQLSFGEILIEEAEEKGRYHYEVVIQQVAKTHDWRSGKLDLALVGQQNGKKARIPLSQLVSEGENASHKLKFRYFQRVEGNIDLPEIFTPEAIELVAKFGGKKPVTVEKQIDWQVQKRG